MGIVNKNDQHIELCMMESIETRLTRPFIGSAITLYHGSINYHEVIEPMTNNIGTKLSSIRKSSFWTRYKNGATLFSIMGMINANNKEITAVLDLNNMKILVTDKDLQETMNIIKNNVSYVYEVTVPTKIVGRGHNRELDEYTIDRPVKPDSIQIVDYITAKKYIQVTSEDEINQIKINAKKGLIGGFDSSSILDKIVYHSPSDVRTIRKELKRSLTTTVNESGVSEGGFLTMEYIKDRIMNESYFDKSAILKKCEGVIESIAQQLKEDINTDINKTKENILLEKLFEQEFGLSKMCIYWDNKISPLSVNAYTLVSSHFTFNKKKPHIILDKKKGYYDKFHKDHCFMVISRGLLTTTELTPSEALAIILHEIGHNFDYTAYAASTDVITKTIDTINLPDKPNEVKSMLYNFIKGVDTKLASVEWWVKYRNFMDAVALKFNRWANMFLSPISSLQVGMTYLPYTPLYHLINFSRKRKEVFADSFALAYGYGPELASALQKLDNRSNYSDDIAAVKFDKRPVLKFLYNLGIITNELFIMIVDCHGTNQFRIKKMIDNLRNEIQETSYSPEMKVEMNYALNRLEEQYNALIVADPDEVTAMAKGFRGFIDMISNGNPDLINRIKKDHLA